MTLKAIKAPKETTLADAKVSSLFLVDLLRAYQLVGLGPTWICFSCWYRDTSQWLGTSAVNYLIKNLKVLSFEKFAIARN